jgi:hypothetical protein
MLNWRFLHDTAVNDIKENYNGIVIGWSIHSWISVFNLQLKKICRALIVDGWMDSWLEEWTADNDDNKCLGLGSLEIRQAIQEYKIQLV